MLAVNVGAGIREGTISLMCHQHEHGGDEIACQ